MNLCSLFKIFFYGFLVIALPGVVYGQIFSPGKLSSPHQHLEGLKNCKKCHLANRKSRFKQLCLDCHQPIKERLKNRRGFHGQKKVRQKQCQQCHHEHQGLDNQLIKWPPGGDKKLFPHQETGFSLRRAHKKVECQTCHQPGMISDAGVRDWLKKYPKKITYLGLKVSQCQDCHFDEHRGQFGDKKCESCHNQEKWQDTPGFSHDQTRYPLTGAHRKLKCEKCHLPQKDKNIYPSAAKGQGTKGDSKTVKFRDQPRKQQYLLYGPMKYNNCTDCHKDVHANKFGQNCKKCHNTTSWARVKLPQGELAMHQKTKFPLKGLHRSVKCKSCHALKPNGELRTKGRKYKRCRDCHDDAHFGQLNNYTQKGDCKFCHSVEGFAPARFDYKRHNELSRFKLEGAHLAVACNKCHFANPKRFKARLNLKRLRFLKRKKRKPLFNYSTLKFPDQLLDKPCSGCHPDPHQGRFAAKYKDCSQCHNQEDFARQAKFDHQTTRFPLQGKHKQLACAACHQPLEGQGDILQSQEPAIFKGWHKNLWASKKLNKNRNFRALWRFRQITTPFKTKLNRLYTPIKMSCRSCHADPHLGQFKLTAKGDKFQYPNKQDCSRCHTFEDFKKLRFDHQKDSSYHLKGKHRDLECSQCHIKVATSSIFPGLDASDPLDSDADKGEITGKAGSGFTSLPKSLVLYKNIPTNCAGCHQDPHRGAFRGYVLKAEVNAQPANSDLVGNAAAANKTTDCLQCHNQSNWHQTKFSHQNTAFPLLGAHTRVACYQCHKTPGQMPGKKCSSCHQSNHPQIAQPDCQNCHNQNSFTHLDGVQAHSRTLFPLQGAHLGVPCLSCHQSSLTRTSWKVSTRCVACHLKDYNQTSLMGIPHASLNFTKQCESCHSTETWQQGNYYEHGACFPITSGNHSNIRCIDCHKRVPKALGACNSNSVNCINCHACSKHPNKDKAPGFFCSNSRCINCHPDGREPKEKD